MVHTKKINSVFTTDKTFPSRNMATVRNKRKLTAVSRETPEGSRSSRGRNVLDPEFTQDYISQVSKEIEGRVTKKFSEEFNKTESRILGALSKLDEFLLNPQVRTCSVVQGASRNANLESRETHRDRSSNDPYPEVGYFPHHSGQLNSPETELNSHVVTENYPHNYLTDNKGSFQRQNTSVSEINVSAPKATNEIINDVFFEKLLDNKRNCRNLGNTIVPFFCCEF